jgi:hypothetical protein
LEEKFNINKQVKSKKRDISHSEVFTIERKVSTVPDLEKHETERIDSCYLEKMNENDISYKIIAAEMELHKILGPGFFGICL